MLVAAFSTASALDISTDVAQPMLPPTACRRLQQGNFLHPGMKIATYHDHDVGSFLHAGALDLTCHELNRSPG